MEVSLENTGSLSRALTVQVPAAEVDGRVDERIKELGRNVRLKGFRPGKVPVQVLRQRFEGQVRQEILGDVIQETFQKAIVDKELRPVSAPSIDATATDAGADVCYTATFDVFPEVEALKVDDLALEKPVATVADTDIDNMISTLREQRRRWEDVDQAAAEGNLSFFSYRVDMGDDGVFPEGEADDGTARTERAGAILGHGAFDAGFESELVGLSKGDEKEFDIEFGDSARDERLKGKSGKASVKIEKVQMANLPELDDAFAESFGVEEGGVTQFREDVRENLERELRQQVSKKMRSEVIGALIAAHPEIEAPESMVTAEAEAMRGRAVSRMTEAGGDADSVPDVDSFREAAEQRVRGGLLIAEVARHAKLEVDMGRVRDQVNEIASTFEDPQSIAALYYQREDLMSGVQNVVLEEQAVEWTLERAKVTEKELSFEDAMKAARESEAG